MRRRVFWPGASIRARIRRRSAEKFAEVVRTHWHVETYHGKRDNGYHEDAFTRRCDLNVMSAMMVARSFGMWICARNPEKTTGQVKNDLKLHPAKLVRIMMKGGGWQGG